MQFIEGALFAGATVWVLVSLRRLEANLMATLAEVEARLDSLRQTVEDEKAEVGGKLDELRAEIARLQGIANPDFTGVMTKLDELDAAVEGIHSEPVPEPEPTP